MLVKVLLLLVVGLTPLAVLSQETVMVKSYIRKIQIDDSVIILNRYLSEETWDFNKNKISFLQYAITLDTSYKNYLHINHPLNNSKDVFDVYIENGDSSKTYYVYDTINNKKYIYYSDTLIYQQEFKGEKLIKQTCLSGCENTEYFYYNKIGNLDSILSITQKKIFGVNSNTYFIYDSKNRLIHEYSISDINKEYNKDNHGIDFEYWIEYDDIQNSVKTINSKQRNPDDFYEDDETIFDSQNIPLLRRITNITDGIKTIYTIEYEKVK